MRKKIYIFDYRQIRNFYMAKDIINNFKRQSRRWAKAFVINITVKH